MKLKSLIGSGDKIVLFTLPFLVVGIILNVLYPESFGVGGPPLESLVISSVLLVIGITIWIWSVYLILRYASKDKLITSGPFAIVKHPLYTAVSLLVIPWIGFLCNSWVGIIIGLAMYIGNRIFAREEEKLLSKTFGDSWEEYKKKVKIPWL
jgi:protein-S-isoprenylcysteine O-methyltransferase Ste14